jgi:hypothetical protein
MTMPEPALPPQPSAGPAAPGRTRAGSLLQPRFVCAVLVLGVCAVGLNAATQFMQLHFRKLPVPLRVASLQDEATGFPAEVGSDEAPTGRWIQVSRDEPMNAEVEHVLGTREHVMRDYLDARLLPKLDSVTAFEGKRSTSERAAVAAEIRHRPPEERERFVREVQRAAPDAIVRLHVAYYTGLVDTVAHIPDRCYVADGFEPTAHENVAGPFGTYPDGKARDADFRFIQFEDVTPQNRVSRYVGYLFHVNGEYDSDPLGVRARLQKLTEKYGYYAKVELMVTAAPKDPTAKAKASKAMSDFMTTALPQVERMLPDWSAVNAAR